QTFTMLRARSIVFATGAIERPMVFSNNDRPGVMLASAARTYLNRFAVLPGKKIIVATSNDGAWRTAFDLAAAGAEVTVADLRASLPAALVAEAAQFGVVVRAATHIVDLRGGHAVRRATLNGPDGQSEAACDLVCVSGGWSPTVHLTSHLGIKPAYRDDIGGFVPGAFAADRFGAGSMMGAYSTAGAIEDGHRAGTQAASFCGKSGPAPTPSKLDLGETAAAQLREVLPAGRGKAFVDFQNDVTAKDIRQAVHEGMRSIEHVKRFTTNGMATDQGKTSNMHGLAIAAETLGKPIPQVGLTTFRAPYTPVTFGSIVGHARGPLFDPTRKTAIHPWAERQGAVFEDVGQWKRAWYFPKAGEDMHAAVDRECVTVRKTAGLFDASTLGKIEVVGPDAAKFMELLYTNPWEKLEPGRCRYGIMLREDGFIYDDGVVGRLAPDRFH
ncbi:MAG: sarcosine oxidase subunit alpha, partial [Mesorhizobium sp.]